MYSDRPQILLRSLLPLVVLGILGVVPSCALSAPSPEWMDRFSPVNAFLFPRERRVTNPYIKSERRRIEYDVKYVPVLPTDMDDDRWWQWGKSSGTRDAAAAAAPADSTTSATDSTATSSKRPSWWRWLEQRRRRLFTPTPPTSGAYMEYLPLDHKSQPPRATVILFHGIGENLWTVHEPYRRLAEKWRARVIAVEYAGYSVLYRNEQGRGYGGLPMMPWSRSTTTPPTQRNILATTRATLRHLAQRRDLSFGRRTFVLASGHATSFAIDAVHGLSKRGIGWNLGGLILASPVTTLTDVIPTRNGHGDMWTPPSNALTRPWMPDLMHNSDKIRDIPAHVMFIVDDDKDYDKYSRRHSRIVDPSRELVEARLEEALYRWPTTVRRIHASGRRDGQYGATLNFAARILGWIFEQGVDNWDGQTIPRNVAGTTIPPPPKPIHTHSSSFPS